MHAVATSQTASSPVASPASRRERFDQLIAVHLDDLYRYGYWLTGQRAVADDLVQETMLRAWKAFDRIVNPKAAKGWLITILRRENARRFERVRPEIADVPEAALADPDKGYDTSAEAFALRRALQRLAAEYREPLLLQVIHGYSQKEIAVQLGISPAGAGTRLFRARQKLREMLVDEGDAAASA